MFFSYCKTFRRISRYETAQSTKNQLKEISSDVSPSEEAYMCAFREKKNEILRRFQLFWARYQTREVLEIRDGFEIWQPDDVQWNERREDTDKKTLFLFTEVSSCWRDVPLDNNLIITISKDSPYLDGSKKDATASRRPDFDQRRRMSSENFRTWLAPTHLRFRPLSPIKNRSSTNFSTAEGAVWLKTVVFTTAAPRGCSPSEQLISYSWVNSFKGGGGGEVLDGNRRRERPLSVYQHSIECRQSQLTGKPADRGRSGG